MKTLFSSLGADEKEMQAFLKMLELGAQPVSVIAKFMGIPRSSMYVMLERLKALHLVQEFERSNIKVVKCIPVEELEDLLKMKERTLQQSLKIFGEKEKELKRLENRLSLTPKIKFHEGKNEVMKLYEEILKEKKFCALFNPQKVKELMPEYHFKIPETIKINRLQTRELIVNGPDAEEYKKLYASHYHQIKILPANRYFEADTIITEEKIYMIAYGGKYVSGVEIVNKVLAQAQQVLFEELWSKTS